MRFSVTDRPTISQMDVRPTAELAPALVVPWLTRIRYGVIIGQVVLILVAAFLSHMELPLGWLAIPIAVMIGSNYLLGRWNRKTNARRALGLSLAIDIVALTAVLALSGGPANPFTLLFLVQITLSAVVLSKEWTWFLGLLSVLGFAFLFAAHVTLPVLEGHHAAQGFSAHLFGMWIAFVAAALLITILIGRVSEALRTHELEVLRLQDQLNRQEKVTSIATLAAGAAHELGTPLSTIAVVAKELEHYAQENSGDPHVRAEAQLIRSGVERCGEILRGMSAKGAQLSGEAPQLIAFEELFRQIRDAFPEAQRATIRTDAHSRESAVLPVVTTRQVLSALVKNSLDANTGEKPVEITGAVVNGKIRFTVRDFGTGMSAETLKRVGEPFFTTKPAGRGMGLGTFLVRVFAENVRGSLTFDSEPDQGTTAILEWPMVRHDAE
jgi:two-component system, sensor histidine kinase RegB